MPATPRRTKRRRVLKHISDDSIPSTTKCDTKQSHAGDDSRRPIHCYGCNIEIGSEPHILCVECNDVHLCFACFSVGAYLPPHQWEHSYRIISSESPPLFDAEWASEEEIKFLGALFQYGLHQWALVSKRVGSKSRVKCEQHYYDVYLNSDTAPLPDPEIIFPPGFRSSYELDLSDDECTGEETENSSQIKIGEVSNRSLKKSEGHVIAGYMPKRSDFDVEFNDGAEAILADVEIGDDDSAEEIELKMKLVDIYNTRLDERERKKKFLFERGLLDLVQMRNTAHVGPKDEQHFIQRLRAWTQLQTPAEQEEAEKTLLNEWKTLKELCRVKRWIASGVKSRTEGEHFDRISDNRSTNRSKLDPTKRTQCLSPMHALPIQDLPGVDQLSSIERELCSALELAPASFASLKEVAFKSAEAAGDTSSASRIKVVKFDPSSNCRSARAIYLPQRDAAALGYQSVPNLRARRRLLTKKAEVAVFDKWTKKHGRVEKVRLAKGVKVDRWGVDHSGEEREEHENFFDEHCLAADPVKKGIGKREYSERFFDRVASRMTLCPESSPEPSSVLISKKNKPNANVQESSTSIRILCDPLLHPSSCKLPCSPAFDDDEPQKGHSRVNSEKSSKTSELYTVAEHDRQRTSFHSTAPSKVVPRAMSPKDVKQDLAGCESGTDIHLSQGSYDQKCKDAYSRSAQATCTEGSIRASKVPDPTDTTSVLPCKRTLDDADSSDTSNLASDEQPYLSASSSSSRTSDLRKNMRRRGRPRKHFVLKPKLSAGGSQHVKKKAYRKKQYIFLNSPARSLRSSDRKYSLRDRRD